MQGAADSAVYEAALTYINGGQTVYVAHAQAVAGQNGGRDGVGGVTVAVNKPPQAGSYAGMVISGNGNFTNGCVGDGTASFGNGDTAQLVE